MANFLIVPGSQFPGEFRLAANPGHILDDAEQAYVNAMDRVMTLMERDHDQDPKGTDDAAVTMRQARLKRRDQALGELRAQAEEFVAGELGAEIAADNVFTIRGKYIADLGRLAGSLFVVEPKVENGQVTDALIRVAEDLSVSSDPAAQAKQDLYVALDGAKTVVKTVARRIEDRGQRFWHSAAARNAETSRARRLRDEYMKKLVEIGRLGLQHPHVELGKLALNGFRAEFVAQEAGRIKNAYVRSLGIAAGLAASVLFLIYIVADAKGGVTGFWAEHKVFFLAGGGAAIGTWLSFSIRRVTLSFDDLGILEDDLLDPSLRVLFVVTLTTVICLLFWTGAVNIEIGNLIDPAWVILRASRIGPDGQHEACGHAQAAGGSARRAPAAGHRPAASRSNLRCDRSAGWPEPDRGI